VYQSVIRNTETCCVSRKQAVCGYGLGITTTSENSLKTFLANAKTCRYMIALTATDTVNDNVISRYILSSDIIILILL